MKFKTSYTTKTKCSQCRRHNRKCILSKNSSTCEYCEKNEFICNHYKPARAELEITRLKKEMITMQQQIEKLKIRITKLEKDNIFFKRNFLQRKLLDEELNDFIEN